MSGKPRNQELGAQGGDITLDVEFRSYAGGPLVDPDSTPTVSIKDPSNDEQDSGDATKTSVGIYTYTYSIDVADEISSTWKIEWTAQINGSSVPSAWEYFSVVAAGSIGFGSDILMDDIYLEQIKKVLAYPSVDSILLADADIKNLCVRHSLNDYFKKFPVEKRVEQSVTGAVEVPFPDYSADSLVVFAAKDVRVVGKQGQADSSNFWDIVKYNSLYGGQFGQSVGFYKTPYNFGGMVQSLQARRQVMDSHSNEQTYKYYVNYEAQQIEVYSETNAKLVIVWACYSNDFAKVKYTRQYEVIQLCQAYLLEHLADTTNIVTDSSLDQSVNSAELLSRASVLKEEVLTKWDETPDVILLRGA